MDYVKPVDFKQLKAFFLALQQGYFKPDSKQASATVLVDGVRTPVDKGYCLKLLRSFPDLQGDQFNDDVSIIKYLQDPNNRKRLLGHLTQEQQIEITKLLAERPTATGAVGEQPGGGETSAEQGVPAQTPVDTTAGAGGMPGFPSGPSISSARQRIFRIPHAPEPSKIAAANKPVFQRPRLPYSVTNTFKNFGSAAQRFTAANLGRIGRGLGEIAKGVGRGIAGPGLTGTYNLLGKAANGTLNAFERLSGSGLRSATSRSFASSGSKKLAWGLLLGLLFFVFFTGLIGGLAGTTPSGGAAPVVGGAGCPDTSANRDDASCHYLNPSISLFDTSISQQSTNSYIEKYKSQFVGRTINDGTTGTEDEFKKRVNAIVAKAKEVGLNPAVLLGLWKSESNFSTLGRAGNDLGCRPNHPEITTFDEDLLCAVGQKSEGKTYEPSITIRCVLSRDANSDSCNSLRAGRASAGYDSTHPLNYPVTTFDNFMEAYGPYGQLSPEGKHTNCTHTYNTVLDIAKEAGACKVTTPPLAGGGSPSVCSGTTISLGIPKKFLPKPEDKPSCLNTQTEACGRPGTCVSNPTRIVLHTTDGTLDAEATYQYFADGSGGRGIGSHFIIGKDGQTLQLVETLENKVEVAWAVANYADHISLEIVHKGVYNSKGEAPAVQYQATIDLVRKLMRQYNIPVGNIEYGWRANEGRSDDATSEATPGVYGHYQLNPVSRSDPGAGFLRDFKADLK